MQPCSTHWASSGRSQLDEPGLLWSPILALLNLEGGEVGCKFDYGSDHCIARSLKYRCISSYGVKFPIRIKLKIGESLPE
jgi:hypothetical protein